MANKAVRTFAQRSPDAQAPVVVEAQVTVIDPLGAELLLSFALDGHEMTEKIPGRTPPGIGERLRFAFNMRHAHVFDGTTGNHCGDANA